MYRSIILFFLVVAISCFANVYGAITPSAKAQKLVRIDSSRIQIRKFDDAAIKKFKHDPDFDYKESSGEGESWWDRFWDWIWRMIEKLFGGRGGAHATGSAPFVKYVAMALVVGLLIYIIVKICGVENIFRADPKPSNLIYSESLENIHQINFDEAIDAAIAVKDYRLAVRLLYLRSLKQLSDAKLINWMADKTNQAYLNELKNEKQRQSFSIITRQFEFVWYGEFLIDGQAFQNINEFFREFNDSLK